MFFYVLASLSRAFSMTGIVDSLQKHIITEDLYVLECLFLNIGASDKSSAIWVDGGDYAVNIIATSFQKCTSNQGGAFSFTKGIQLQIKLCCIFQCTSTHQAGIGYIELTRNVPLSIDYLCARDCNTKGKHLYITNAVENKLTNCNISGCKGSDNTYYGVVFFTRSQFSYKFCEVSDNNNPGSILYHESSTGSIDSCNILRNIVNKWEHIYLDCGRIDCINCIFVGNTGKPVFSGWHDTIFVNNCIGELSKTLSVDINGCRTLGDSTVFPFTFYGTHFCSANIAYPRMSQTFMPSPIETPFSSPFSSPIETPYSTPNNSPFSSPFNTPQVTPFSSPFSTPNDTPYQSPIETPFSSPINTPFSSPFDTPIFSPHDTPFDSPVNTPFITPFETPFSSFKETLKETPIYTPLYSPGTSPIETHKCTPYDSPLESPYSSPIFTPFSSPELTLKETPLNSPFVSPFSTPINTPLNTPVYTPMYSPIETQINTPFSSPELSPIETPFSTPNLSPVETVIPRTPEISRTLLPTISNFAQFFQNSNPSVASTWIIPLIVVCSIIFVILVSLLIVYLKHRTNESTSTSEISRSESGVLETTTLNTTTNAGNVSLENPLFSVYSNEDPFNLESLGSDDIFY